MQGSYLHATSSQRTFLQLRTFRNLCIMQSKLVFYKLRPTHGLWNPLNYLWSAFLFSWISKEWKIESTEHYSVKHFPQFVTYIVYTVSPCKMSYILWIIVLNSLEPTGQKLLQQARTKTSSFLPLMSYPYNLALYTFFVIVVKMEMRNY